MPKRIANPKIACLDFSLQKTKMKLNVQVLRKFNDNIIIINNKLIIVHIKTRF